LSVRPKRLGSTKIQKNKIINKRHKVKVIGGNEI